MFFHISSFTVLILFVFDSGLVLVLRSKQLSEQEEVDVVLPLDKEKGISLEDFKLIKMHMANCTSLFSISLLLVLVLYNVSVIAMTWVSAFALLLVSMDFDMNSPI
jgi:hypothetical protein